MTLKTLGLGLALAAFPTGSVFAMCGHAQMTIAEAPKTDKRIVVADVPVDLWLMPYLA